jgi:hypothetical protein
MYRHETSKAQPSVSTENIILAPKILKKTTLKEQGSLQKALFCGTTS